MSEAKSEKTMDVMESIQKRRSIRKFRSDPVPESIMTELIEAARLAPSGSNLQPWRFMVVDDPEQLLNISRIAYDQRVFREAPAVIVCCADLRSYSDNNRLTHREELSIIGVFKDIGVSPEKLLSRTTVESGDRQYIPSAFLNVAIAAEHIVLRATSLGLGTCWVGAFDQKALLEYLELPEHMIIVALLPVGYPAQEPSARPRLSLDQIMLPCPSKSK